MKEMDSLLPRGAAILSSAAFDPVDLGMLDSCLLGKLLLRHASLKPRFDHRAHDLGLGHAQVDEDVGHEGEGGRDEGQADAEERESLPAP